MDRTWAKQHDDEVDSVANANPQPPWAQLPLPQVDVPPPPPRPPQAKPIMPRWTLLHDDTSYSLISPSIQPLAGHIQTASNTLLEPRVPVVVTVPVVSTSVPQREAPERLLAHPRLPRHLVSSPLVVRLLPLSPRRLGQSSYLPLAMPRLTTTSRFGTLYSRT